MSSRKNTYFFIQLWYKVQFIFTRVFYLVKRTHLNILEMYNALIVMSS